MIARVRVSRVGYESGGKLKAIACALLLGAFMLSSCQGQAAEPKPKSEATKTAPANPEATLPPMPAAANEFTPSGANEFVAYFVEVLEYASQTGDLEELRRISRGDCGGCQGYMDLFTEIRESGGYVGRRDWSTGEIELISYPVEGYEWEAKTSLDISAGIVQKSMTSKPHRHPSASGKVHLGLVFDGSWRISYFASTETRK